MKKPVITYKYEVKPVGGKETGDPNQLFNVLSMSYIDGREGTLKKLYKRLPKRIAEDIVFRLERRIPIPPDIFK